MIVTTYINVPDYVYSYFLKLAENQPDKSPETLMELYLKRHVKAKLGIEAHQKRSDTENSSTSKSM